MPQSIINAMLAAGWSYSVIALRAKISEDRLRTYNLGRREHERLMQVAELEAHIELDELED